MQLYHPSDTELGKHSLSLSTMVRSCLRPGHQLTARPEGVAVPRQTEQALSTALRQVAVATTPLLPLTEVWRAHTIVRTTSRDGLTRVRFSC